MNIIEKYRTENNMTFADLGKKLGCSWKWAKSLCQGGNERLLPMRVQFALKVEKTTGLNLINELKSYYGQSQEAKGPEDEGV